MEGNGAGKPNGRREMGDGRSARDGSQIDQGKANERIFMTERQIDRRNTISWRVNLITIQYASGEHSSNSMTGWILGAW